jgi:hypothetical protein
MRQLERDIGVWSGDAGKKKRQVQAKKDKKQKTRDETNC